MTPDTPPFPDPVAQALAPCGHWRALDATCLDALQALFEASPRYFEMAYGHPARPQEAQRQWADTPPPHLPHGERRLEGLFDRHGRLLAFVESLDDMIAPGVAHLGFFIVHEAHWGTGLAGRVYRAWEAGAKARGADVVRLGVLQENLRGEQFWLSQGFLRLRERHGVEMGEKVHRLWVMAKPLVPVPHDPLSVEAWKQAYWARVPRDDPRLPQQA